MMVFFCCQYGQGSYDMKYSSDGSLVENLSGSPISGGSFGASQAWTFQVGQAETTTSTTVSILLKTRVHSSSFFSAPSSHRVLDLIRTIVPLALADNNHHFHSTSHHHHNSAGCHDHDVYYRLRKWCRMPKWFQYCLDDCHGRLS